MAKILKVPDFSLEENLEGLVVGIDEVGCGPWAGPVVAGAVIFLPASKNLPWLSELRDSKQLSAKRREILYEKITLSTDILTGLGQASVTEIDNLNIAQATCLAMQRAIADLPQQPSMALIDGIRQPVLSIPAQMIIKGDQVSRSIAAASILAKVWRDRMMAKLDQEFPVYGWARNAGYGTAEHQKALNQYGITLHHRRSFAPIARFVSHIHNN